MAPHPEADACRDLPAHYGAMVATVSKWSEFYVGRAGNSYLRYAERRYAPFIDAIRVRIRPNDYVMELGAGVGTITAALERVTGSDVRFAATDSDPEQVAVMRQRFRWRRLPVDVGWRDASVMCTVGDVVHSHGMLEHFDDETIRRVIRSHPGARHQIHYVPGLYDKPSFGDERLMSVDSWWRICKPTQIVTFNQGLDYALIFDR
jgi:Methyltransferase domain